MALQQTMPTQFPSIWLTFLYFLFIRFENKLNLKQKTTSNHHQFTTDNQTKPINTKKNQHPTYDWLWTLCYLLHLNNTLHKCPISISIVLLRYYTLFFNVSLLINSITMNHIVGEHGKNEVHFYKLFRNIYKRWFAMIVNTIYEWISWLDDMMVNSRCYFFRHVGFRFFAFIIST